MKKVYLDNNSTTKVDDRVIQAIIEEYRAGYGNPSSIHSFGQEAKNRLTKARRQIAQFFGFKPTEVVFTSSATEAVNMVIRGTKGGIVTSVSEHSCVNAACQREKEKGRDVVFLETGLKGYVTPDQVKNAIGPETGLITLMAVNNETGVKTDVEAIAALAEEANIPFFVDAVAMVGKERFVPHRGVSAVAISGHKIHAPKGIGALLLRSSFKPDPLIVGGAQEYQMRAGTPNVSGIIGLAKAIELLSEGLQNACEKMKALRDHFESEVLRRLTGVTINGEGERVVNTTNLSFEDVDGESLLLKCDLEGLAVSHGSACTSGALEPSRILMSMGMGKERARNSLRLSLSRMTTEEEIERAIEIIVSVVTSLR